jgi:hypothetical protein
MFLVDAVLNAHAGLFADFAEKVAVLVLSDTSSVYGGLGREDILSESV